MHNFQWLILPRLQWGQCSLQSCNMTALLNTSQCLADSKHLVSINSFYLFQSGQTKLKAANYMQVPLGLQVQDPKEQSCHPSDRASLPLGSKELAEWWGALNPDACNHRIFQKQVLLNFLFPILCLCLSHKVEGRQMNCCEVRKNELTHRKPRVLIRNISSQCMAQYCIQESSLPDILAKAAYTYSCLTNFRAVSITV